MKSQQKGKTNINKYRVNDPWWKIAEEIWYIPDNCLIYKMPKIAVRTFTDVNKEILIKKQIK